MIAAAWPSASATQEATGQPCHFPMWRTSMTMSQITTHSSRDVCALLLWSRSLRAGGPEPGRAVEHAAHQKR